MPPWPAPASAAELQRLRALLRRPPAEAAPALLGHLLVRRVGAGVRAVRIVETEAYLGRGDPAAHAYRGQTARNRPLFGPPGTTYVYFIYGMHHCLNLAVQPAGTAGCVLLRAAEPWAGSGLGPLDARGPGRLCRALDIALAQSGKDALDPDGELVLREGRPPVRFGVSPRVGIHKAAEWPLRFFDADSPAVSGPPARAATLVASASEAAARAKGLTPLLIDSLPGSGPRGPRPLSPGTDKPRGQR